MPAFGPRFTASHPIMAALTTIEQARGFLEAEDLWTGETVQVASHDDVRELLNCNLSEPLS